jgi:hypothetical protein
MPSLFFPIIYHAMPVFGLLDLHDVCGGLEVSCFFPLMVRNCECKCTAPPRFKSLRLEFGCLFRLYTMPTSHSKVGESFLYSLFASFAS